MESENLLSYSKKVRFETWEVC